MNVKNYQSLTDQYYRLTEQTYRSLHPDGTDLMNLGIWPAQNILEAQRKMYSIISDLCFEVINKEDESNLDSVYELGCGWGGGISILDQKLNPKKFVGVNSSKNQIEHCKEKYKSDKFSFYFGYYDSIKIQNTNEISLAVGVESLLHCGDRNAIFEMMARNNIKYIALAEILLIDDKAKNHKFFNPALKFAANFDEYQKLFRSYGYELVIERDITKNVFLPWASALAELTSHLTGLQKKIKEQFIESYSELAKLGEQSAAKYVLFIAKKTGAK